MRTSFRLRSVERFGRMSTSLKSSFVSCGCYSRRRRADGFARAAVDVTRGDGADGYVRADETDRSAAIDGAEG